MHKKIKIQNTKNSILDRIASVQSTIMFVIIILVSLQFSILGCQNKNKFNIINNLKNSNSYKENKTNGYDCVMLGVLLPLSDIRCHDGIFYCCLKRNYGCCLWRVTGPPTNAPSSILDDSIILAIIVSGDTTYQLGTISNIDTTIYNTDTIISITDMNIDSTWQ